MIFDINTLRNIKKAFRRASIRADFFQLIKNEFGEDENEELLITTNGIFYEEKTRINLNVSTNGKSTTKTYKSLMVLKDDKTELIKKHMICLINSKRYEIIDINNDGELNIYYVLRLSEINED